MPDRHSQHVKTEKDWQIELREAPPAIVIGRFVLLKWLFDESYCAPNLCFFSKSVLSCETFFCSEFSGSKSSKSTQRLILCHHNHLLMVISSESSWCHTPQVWAFWCWTSNMTLVSLCHLSLSCRRSGQTFRLNNNGFSVQTLCFCFINFFIYQLPGEFL